MKMDCHPVARDTGPANERGRLAFCAGKEPLTAELARQIVQRQGRSKSRDKKRCAYRCPFCKAWHIGNPPPKAVRGAGRNVTR